MTIDNQPNVEHAVQELRKHLQAGDIKCPVYIQIVLKALDEEIKKNDGYMDLYEAKVTDLERRLKATKEAGEINARDIEGCDVLHTAFAREHNARVRHAAEEKERKVSLFGRVIYW